MQQLKKEKVINNTTHWTYGLIWHFNFSPLYETQGYRDVVEL